MEKTNFWDDAARWGALMAVVQILFSTVGLFWKSQVLSLLSLAVFITLLFVLTKRRALLYGSENGYSYGQCMKYIFWMMCFSGVLVGAWEIAARRLLFPAYYEAALEESLKMVSSLYGPAQMELAVSMARTIADLDRSALDSRIGNPGLLLRAFHQCLCQAGDALAESSGRGYAESQQRVE